MMINLLHLYSPVPWGSARIIEYSLWHGRISIRDINYGQCGYGTGTVCGRCVSFRSRDVTKEDVLANPDEARPYISKRRL
jgi:hypothetical protein